MKILVTGCAGFIGFSYCLSQLKKNKIKIFGVDNINNYYDVKLKNVGWMIGCKIYRQRIIFRIS